MESVIEVYFVPTEADDVQQFTKQDNIRISQNGENLLKYKIKHFDGIK